MFHAAYLFQNGVKFCYSLTIDETFQVNLICFELCRYIIINMTIILKENISSIFLYVIYRKIMIRELATCPWVVLWK